MRNLMHAARTLALASASMTALGSAASAQTTQPMPNEPVQPQSASEGTAAPANVVTGSSAPTSTTPASSSSRTAASAEIDTGDIVVTARRVAESLQRVPVAITALAPDVLAKANIRDQFSLFSQVPGLASFNRFVGAPTTLTTARIRGVSGIALYFAEAPSGASQAAYYAPYFDVESIQVLKGPQGTLFGQASNAGAELFEPRRPGNEFGGYVQSDVGTYGVKNFEAAVDLPIVADRVLLRVAGKVFNRDGYIKNITSNQSIGAEKYDVLRATLVLKPFDGLSNETIYQHEDVSDITGMPVSVLGDFNFSPNSQIPITFLQANLNGMTVNQFNAARDRLLAQQIRLGRYKFEGLSIGCPATPNSPATASTVPGPDFNNTRTQGCSPSNGAHKDDLIINKTTLELADSLQIKSILSRSSGRTRTGTADTDVTRFILVDFNPKTSVGRKDPTVTSAELQLSGKLFDRLSFVAGGFRYFSKLNPDFERPVFGQYIVSLADTATTSRARNSNWSGYAQINMDLQDLIPGLTFTGGYRRSYDRASVTNYALNPTTREVISTSGGPGTPAGSGKWTSSSYTLGLQYQATPTTMIYVTNSRGSGAGGLQNIAGFEQYNPDHLNNFEAGLKTAVRLSDDVRIRFDLAGYYGRYSDVQVSRLVLSTNPATGAPVFTSAIQNAASAKIKGFEAEANLSLFRRVQIRGFAGYSSANYSEYNSLDPVTGAPVDLSGTPFASNPPWKWGFSASYDLPLPKTLGLVSLSTTFSHQSQAYASVTKPLTPTDPSNPNTGTICKVRRTVANGYNLSADGGLAYKNCVPSWSSLNATLSWDDPLGARNLRLALTVTNVMNKDSIVAIDGVYDFLGFEEYIPQQPRMLFASVRYKF